jgi:perosamine synthetase
VAVANGTAALHLSLLLTGVKPGYEVLVPNLTFIATANAVSYCGAVPHFVDVEEMTLAVDPKVLADYLKTIIERTADGSVNKQTGRPLRHLVVMHAFGHPAQLDELQKVCAEYGITLIEDAAESLGSYYKGTHTGNVGRVAALSFNGNKVVTTGGGGAILTNDEELGRLAKHLSTTAKVSHPYKFVHDMVGYNYRMPNINAALGCAQLEKLDEFLVRKRNLADRYREAFAHLKGLRFFTEPSHGRSNYWLNCLLLDRGNEELLEPILEATNKAGFGTRPIWTLMHKLPMYSECPRMATPVAESLEQRVINIPSSMSLVKSKPQTAALKG